MATASFPDYRTTGAVHHFVKTPGDPTNTYYLGTCEVQPVVQFYKMRAPVKNDLAGDALPAQKTHQGEMATLGLQFTRWSLDAYDTILNCRGTGNGLNILAGWEGRFSRGSLVFGSDTFQLWQVFDNALNAVFRGDLPLGWYWPQVEIVQHAPVKLGTREYQLLLMLEANPKYVPQASMNQIQANERSWFLYSTQDADFPAAVQVPQ